MSSPNDVYDAWRVMASAITAGELADVVRPLMERWIDAREEYGWDQAILARRNQLCWERLTPEQQAVAMTGCEIVGPGGVNRVDS